MSFDFTVKEFILGNGTGLGQPFQFYRRGFNLGSSGSQPSWQDIILSGNGSLTLTNAKANGINYVKLFGNAEQRNLPEGYTQLSFIESTGSQYIDTGIVLKSEATITMVAQATSFAGSGPFVFWGFMGTGNFPRWSWSIFSNAWMPSLNATSSAGNADTNKHTFINTCYYVDDVLKYSGFLDGSILIYPTETLDVATYTSNTLSAYLFARNNNGTAGNFLSCRIFSYEIVQDGVKVLSLVPCRRNSDNVLGMYDTVTGTFFTNAGTGDFVAGSAVVPTPDEPLSIISNNGTIKYSLNMANVNAQTALIGYYISSSGVVTADPNNWIYQDFIPVKPSTTYTLTMSSSVYYVTISEYSTADDSGFITRKAGSSGDNTTLTITTGSNTNYIRFGTNIYRGEVTLDTVLAIDWMLNVGDTMAYQPYVEGGIYTDGTVETVEVTGKNLFDKDANWGTWYPSISNTIASAATNRTVVIRCLPNTKYYFKHCTYRGGLRAFYTEEENWGIGSPCSYFAGAVVGDANVVYSITTSANAKWLFVCFGRIDSSTTATYAQQASDYMLSIEELTSATEYQSYYNGGSATAEMLLKLFNKGGDSIYAQDTQNVTTGEVTRNVGVIVIDGVTVKIGTAWNPTYKRGSFVISDMASTLSSVDDALCNYFDYSSSVYGSPTVAGFCTNNGTIFFSFLGIDSVTSANTANAWFAQQYVNGTPVVVVYPLATPTTETVTGQPLNIQAGTNVVEITQASMDNLGLEVSYKGTVTP